jgi:cell division protein FtsL
LKRLALVVLLVVLGFFVFSLAGLTLQSYRLAERTDAVREEIAGLQEENKRLQADVERLQTPSALEELARKELGLIKEGETSVVIDYGPGERPSDVPTPTPTPRPNRQSWWETLFGS